MVQELCRNEMLNVNVQKRECTALTNTILRNILHSVHACMFNTQDHWTHQVVGLCITCHQSATTLLMLVSLGILGMSDF
jgi:hypothetical protein